MSTLYSSCDNLELKFTTFVKGDKIWHIIETNKDWIDTWKCEKTKEYVKCSRKDLLNWLNKGYIVPIS